eukprot:scaffold55567_cov28-Tisochrysis_lutea.AAC.7
MHSSKTRRPSLALALTELFPLPLGSATVLPAPPIGLVVPTAVALAPALSTTARKSPSSSSIPSPKSSARRWPPEPPCVAAVDVAAAFLDAVAAADAASRAVAISVLRARVRRSTSRSACSTAAASRSFTPCRKVGSSGEMGVRMSSSHLRGLSSRLSLQLGTRCEPASANSTRARNKITTSSRGCAMRQCHATAGSSTLKRAVVLGAARVVRKSCATERRLFDSPCTCLDIPSALAAINLALPSRVERNVFKSKHARMHASLAA